MYICTHTHISPMSDTMRRQRKHHGYGATRTPTANGVAIAFDTTTTHKRPAVPYSWRENKKNTKKNTHTHTKRRETKKKKCLRRKEVCTLRYSHGYIYTSTNQR